MSDACPSYLEPDVIYSTSMARKGDLKVKIFRPIGKKGKPIFIALVPLMTEDSKTAYIEEVQVEAFTITEAFNKFMETAQKFIDDTNEDIQKIEVYDKSALRKIKKISES